MKSTEQMKKYRVRVNLHRIHSIIKDFKLREFTGVFPTVDITAKDPDDACGVVKNNLLDLLIGQKGINKDILIKVSEEMSIKKITRIDE